MDARWYALYTKPRWEKKVAQLLTTRQVTNYCPLNQVLRQWSDRKKIVYEPLFTSYVFVHIPEKQLGQLRQVDGVLHCVYWLGKPAVIREEEIAAIRRFLQQHQQVRAEKYALRRHDTIKMTQGSFCDQQGVVVGLQNKHLKVALPSLGYMLHAVVDKSSVEKIS